MGGNKHDVFLSLLRMNVGLGFVKDKNSMLVTYQLSSGECLFYGSLAPRSGVTLKWFCSPTNFSSTSLSPKKL